MRINGWLSLLKKHGLFASSYREKNKEICTVSLKSDFVV